jgi:ribonuclease D
VAAWREREAQARDVPRGRVLKDDAVVDVAVSAPRSPEALGRLRSIPGGFERSRTALDILEAVERGLARDPKTVPVPERTRRGSAAGATVELLKVLLKAVAETEGVAPKIIATVEELEAIAENNDANVPSLHGWRRSLFGEKALALKAGELGLAMQRGRVVVRSVPDGD